MTQNAMKMPWTEEEVEEKLHTIMKNIFKNISEAAEKYGKPGDYIAGANLAAAERILIAMEEQGVV
jgi:glutamate dehydrogenase (NADP+)